MITRSSDAGRDSSLTAPEFFLVADARGGPEAIEQVTHFKPSLSSSTSSCRDSMVWRRYAVCAPRHRRTRILVFSLHADRRFVCKHCAAERVVHFEDAPAEEILAAARSVAQAITTKKR